MTARTNVSEVDRLADVFAGHDRRLSALERHKVQGGGSGGGGDVPSSRRIDTTGPLHGGGDLSANRMLTVDGFTTAQPGVVPASGGGTAKFLRADGTWSAPPAATDEVFIGPDDPIGTTPTIELWYDTDAISPAVGVGLPAGGVAGAVLTKRSATDYDAAWIDHGIRNGTLTAGTVAGSASRVVASLTLPAGRHLITYTVLCVSTAPIRVGATLLAAGVSTFSVAASASVLAAGNYATSIAITVPVNPATSTTYTVRVDNGTATAFDTYNDPANHQFWAQQVG